MDKNLVIAIVIYVVVLACVFSMMLWAVNHIMEIANHAKV